MKARAAKKVLKEFLRAEKIVVPAGKALMFQFPEDIDYSIASTISEACQKFGKAAGVSIVVFIGTVKVAVIDKE